MFTKNLYRVSLFRVNAVNGDIMKITKDTTIAEALKYPGVAEILAKYGVACFGCPMMSLERIEDIARIHGVDIDNLLKELNDAIEKNG